ncbi:hypothetical protein ACFX2K_024449 [Malus domestica]
MGKNGWTERQGVATSQGFGHRHVLDQAFIGLGTTNEFVIPVEEEGFVFPLPQVLIPSVEKVEIESVVVEEVLVKFLNFLILGLLALSAQCFDGPIIEKSLQVNGRQLSVEGSVNWDAERGSP